MHRVLKVFVISDDVSVLSCGHENWEDVEVGAATLVLTLLELISINHERLSVFQVLLNDSFPVMQDSLLALVEHFVVVFLLLFREITVGANSFAWDGHIPRHSRIANIGRTHELAIATTDSFQLCSHNS